MGWLVIFEDLFWCLCLVLEIVGEVGDGVWVIYMVDVDGGVCVEQVYVIEFDVLCVNKDNIDLKCKVCFLLYGIVVSVFDDLVDEVQ